MVEVTGTWMGWLLDGIADVYRQLDVGCRDRREPGVRGVGDRPDHQIGLAILARLHGQSAQWSGSTQDASVAETVLAQAEEMLAMRR